MRIYIYTGGEKLVSKSGVGQAIRHQQEMLRRAGVDTTEHWTADTAAVHVNTVLPDSLLAVLAARIRGRKVVYYGHSTMQDFRSSFKGSDLLAPLFCKWIKFCYGLGDVVLTPTEYSRKLLESYGNRVRCVEDFADVLGEFAACQPQLVLMDIKLPYRDGYYWCSRIREISAVPVVFLSSASDNMNIVMALNMGGDDFIAKPVDPMVLTAKVQAVLRRTYEITGAGQTVEFCGATLSLGDGCLHTEKGRVELTKNEFRILQLLLENRGKIVSREELMMRLWQSDLYVEENTLTVNVARLRKKLEEGGLEGVILTKPGRGYIIL